MVVISADWAPVALRIVLAVVFIVHGYPKLFKDFKGTSSFLAGLGFNPGAFWALILGVSEFFGGIALLLGAASRVVASLLIISMTVATLIKIFKWKTPFTKNDASGWEFDLLLVAGLVTIFLLGSGNWSIDRVVGWILG
ncbi:DoxX family protein [Candidatus Woesearchaeota archaeon]|nr:DoxX family protein [Candidatus Woesearchaeota archaeon]